jgi:hypothetical protein
MEEIKVGMGDGRKGGPGGGVGRQERRLLKEGRL